jgi:hypothetical protein
MEWRRRKELAIGCALTAILAAALLATTGCGGSGGARPTGSTRRPAGSATSRTVPAQSHSSSDPAAASALIAKADAICRRANHELAASPPHLEASQIARSAPRNAALETRAVAELAKLTPPASLALDFRQIIAYRRTLAGELIKLARSAKANDARGMQALAASKKQVHRKLSELATRNGFKDCSEASAAPSGAQSPLSPLFGHRPHMPVKL